MKKIQSSKMLKNTLIMFLFFMSIEITFRLISGINVIDPSILRLSIGCLIISTIIGYILSWTKQLIARIVISLLVFIFTIYSFLQLGFNNFIGVYMSVNTSSQLGAVTDYVREFLSSFLPSYYLIFIPFVVLLLYMIFFDKRLSKVYNEKRFILKKKSKYEYELRTVTTMIVLILLCFAYHITLTANFMQKELQTVSNMELFKNPSVPSVVVNEFGILGFGFLDIKSVYIEPEEVIILKSENNKNHYTNRVFEDTKWQEVINEEIDANMISINNYLINNDITDYNEYTGRFEGKNLIVIMLESVNDVFINEEYFPNFYKLYSEGWHYENNYSPRNSCATGNNEFSAMTGLYTIYNSCTANVYKNNTYYQAIFNLFNDKGYRTSSMHDYTEHYYDRSIIHNNLGSNKYYGVEDLGISYSNVYRNWASDEEFMKVAMDITLNSNTENPFMLWLTTVTSHQPYAISSIEGDKYLDLFSNTNYPIDLQRYMSKLKDLDNALGVMLDNLEAKGILDDTVIVMFGDHYPYGLSNETLSYVLDYDLDDYEVERVPFVIYNSEETPQTFYDYTSYINITPTLANLFGLNYDPRLYMGLDLFSEEYESRVVFADGSWKNENAYYNAANGEIKYYTDKLYTLEEIKNINNTITNKMQISSLIIKNNYFAYLNEKLNNIEIEENVLAEAILEGES